MRIDCIAFYKETYKWLGETLMTNYTRNLKKAQLDELSHFYTEWGSQSMTPLRGGASTGDPSATTGTVIDAYNIVDAVDLFVKYNDKWMDKVLAMEKWKEKTDQIDELIKAASVPKLVAP